MTTAMSHRHRRRQRRVTRLLAAALCMSIVQGAVLKAAEVAWNGTRFAYASHGGSVADTLRIFAASQDLTLQLDGPVDGVFSGRFAMPPRRFLDTLCATYGLVWYYDGAVLHVSAASAQQNLEIRPNYLTPQALNAALARVGAVNRRFPLHTDTAKGTLDIVGPPAYVEHVRDTAASLEADARVHTRTVVHIYRLRTATAADQIREHAGQRLTVPGVATRLRQRLADHRAAATQQASDPQAPTPLEFDAPLPVIEADAATNSILVRDRPERIDGDGALIEQADTRPELISLQTFVVDVAADALPDLQADVQPPLTIGHAALAPEGGRALLAHLAGLQQAHRANVQLSRTAFTFDKAPTVLDRHEAALLESDSDQGNGVELWLSLVPAVQYTDGIAQIALQIGWRRPDASQQPADDEAAEQGGQSASANLDPGQAMVVLDGGAAPKMVRLILVVPRIIA
jgi:type III secretion protein C